MTKVTFFQQLGGLVRRNFLIKKRRKFFTAMEIILPIYFVIILMIIRSSSPSVNYPAVTVPRKPFDPLYFLKSLADPIAIVSNLNSSELKKFEDQLKQISHQQLNFTTFNSTDDEFIKNNSFPIIIDLTSDFSGNVSYMLRFLSDELPKTTELFSSQSNCRNELSTFSKSCPADLYLTSGFVTLQYIIDQAISKMKIINEGRTLNVSFQLFPKGEYMEQANYLRSVLPLYMVLAFSPFVTYVVILIVSEKETKIRETMKIMGLKDFAYWTSWLIVYGLFVFIISLLVSLLLIECNILPKANMFLLFINIFLYGISILTLSFMVTPFFNKAKMAGSFSSLASTFISCLYYIKVYVGGANSSVYWIMSLASPTAFALNIDTALTEDLYKSGIGFDSLWEGSFPFASGLIMLLVDIILYAALAYYLDSVLPGEFGVKRRPWFCFLPSFWCGKKANVDINPANGPSNIDENDIEPTPTELLGKEAIRISNLTKVYKKFKEEDVVAVDGITLDIYEGQITALLGHNGAGKTTLLNVLTGLIPSTNGSATIFGFNVSDPESLAKIRQMTGICPQQDVLFADLTPQEHLQFYAAIKGVPADEANSQIKEILKQMDLSEQSDTFSSKLSGGQKRKLSLGIALIGNPKVIILDEPTSGVDPYSRHQLWEFLQGYKKDKAILLTTHFMDEADILADRKAILTKGKLRCVGSSLFLKNRFGLGYHLTMVTTTDYNDSNIKSLITTHIPTAVLMGLQGRELLYILPLGETTKFPSLFEALDEIVENENNSYGVKSYGVSMTTLEQVFHRLGDEDEGEVKKSVSEQILQAEQETIHFKQNESNNPNLENLLPDMQNLPASGTILDGFYALMKIRLLIDLRLPKNFFNVFVSPLIFLSIGFFLLNSSKNVEENLDTPLVLNSDLYKTVSEANLLYSNKTGQNIDFLLNGIKALGINVTPFDNVFEDLLEVQPNTYFLNCTDYDVKQQQISVLALYNDTAQHSVPILMNIIDNALLAENPENFQINITSKPIPHSSNNFSFSSMFFGAVFLVGFLFISLPISFASDVVEDREIQVRQLLKVNGLSFWSYWSSSLISHLLLFLVSLLVMIAFLLIFKIEFLTTGPAMFCLIVTYILYLPTSILYYYNLSFLFSKHETALSLLPILSMIFGFVPFLVVMILDAMPINTDLVPNLHYVFCVIFPLYIPFAGLYFIYKVALGFHLLNLEPHVSDYFNKTIIIMDCVMIIDCFIYIGILRLIDYYKSRGINFKVQQASMNLEESENSGGSVDEDIVDESKRVQTLILTDGSSLPVIVIKSVYKYFRSNLKRKWCQARNDMDSSSGKLAVKNLSFAVESGEVFGLLGPNGAGKTTTLKIIVAEESPTFGQVLVDGLDIHSGQTEAFQSMGYCPQHDALWKNITLKEHLECYSAIRGIPAKARNEIVEQFIKALNLEEHKNKKVIALSGGTKRKLSFAISLLGMKTKVVLLDEPSTGMDPKSKRFLWNIIRSRFFNGTSGAILTTHSMEEADALCSRVGIMIAGELGCLGSIQHLKNKYGAGYILEIKLTEDSTERGMDLSGLQNFVIELFPHAQIQEQFQNRIKYTISQSGVKSIAQAFHQLQAAKDQQLIQEYSFGQTTLEQVFLQFAKKQKDL